MKHLPGPLPSSCVTCYQRKKKCDKRRPVCMRCTTGGFECLGYDHTRPSGSLPFPTRPTQGLEPTAGRMKTDESDSARPSPERTWTCELSDPSTLYVSSLPSSFTPSPSLPIPEPFQTSLQSATNTSSLSITVPRPLTSVPGIGSRKTRTIPSGFSCSDKDFSDTAPHPQDWVSQADQAMNTARLSYDWEKLSCIPPRFVPDPLISGTRIRFIMSQYEPMFKIVFFAQIRTHIEYLRKRMVTRLLSSNITHWAMYLGARIFQSLIQDGRNADMRSYIPWLNRFDKLCITNEHDTTLEDLVSRLSGAIELSFLKYLTSDTNTGYTLMRRIAPTFMQIAFADPTLWPRQPTSSGVSLAHVLVATPYELSRFVFLDAVSSLAFGVSPLVEYDTSHPAIPTREIHPLEWIHGCSVDVVIAITKINVWRQKGLCESNRSETDSCWKSIERDLLKWTPRYDHVPGQDSCKVVARLAIQECWRHAVLIYLYMGMCEMTSHDTRVQKSAHQIVRLLDTMENNIAIGVHCFIPVLVASIAIQSETKRAVCYKAMMCSGDDKTWMFKGLEFGGLLDHLWHGPAANGAAVTWEDYVRSRKAMVPIHV